MPPLSPAAVLAARVALSLAVLAAPAVVVQHHAGLRASRAGQAGAAVSMLAALIPATCWFPAVGAVSHVVAYVVIAVSIGSGLYVGAWYALAAHPHALAAVVAALCGALVAAGFAADVPPIGTIAASVTACLFFTGVPASVAPPQGLVAAAIVVGLSAGGLVFLVATWMIAPVWATDAAFRATAAALDALADMTTADPGAKWSREDGVESEKAPPPPPLPPPPPQPDNDPDTDTEITRPATGEPTRPRAPAFIRRRRRSRRLAAAAAAAAAAPKTPPPPRRPLPKVRPEGAPAPRVGAASLTAVDAAWLRLDGALAGAALALGGARGEIASRGRLRAPWPPLLARAGVWHMPAPALAGVADAARAAARVVWCLHTLVGPVAPPVAALVTRVHGSLAAIDAVAPAARAAAAAIAAACPRAYGDAALPDVPLPVAATELAALRAIVAALAADRDRAAAATHDVDLAAALIESAAEEGGDELRLVGWETTLRPLVATLTKLAETVEVLRGGQAHDADAKV